MPTPVKVQKSVHTLATKLADLLNNDLVDILETNVPTVKEIILESYTSELIDVVINSKSKTRPEYYIDDFTERLDKFDYVVQEDGLIKFIVPDMTTFDFSGRLRVIENILEGIIGNYVEVDGDKWKKLFGKNKVIAKPEDSSVPQKERIYLVKYTPAIRKLAATLGIDLVRYPFSNTAPIDIFTEADKYIEKNLQGWINVSVVNAQEKLSEVY